MGATAVVAARKPNVVVDTTSVDSFALESSLMACMYSRGEIGFLFVSLSGSVDGDDADVDSARYKYTPGLLARVTFRCREIKRCIVAPMVVLHY